MQVFCIRKQLLSPRPHPSGTDDAFHAEHQSGSSGTADSSSRCLVSKLIGIMSCVVSGWIPIQIAHVPGIHVTLFAALFYPSFICTSSNNNKSWAASRIMQDYVSLCSGSREIRTIQQCWGEQMAYDRTSSSHGGTLRRVQHGPYYIGKF